MTPADVSVVIPTFNEAGSISRCIASARAAGAKQIIVADGGSTDSTVDIAKKAGASGIVQSDLGRGIQLNRGAAEATGEVILFLHADNWIGPHCLSQLCQQSKTTWGAYRQRIESSRRIYRSIEAGNAMRVRWLGMAFGDQAVYVRRDLFQEQNGFNEVPLMEDFEFSQRMRRLAKPVLLDGPVQISARRWQQNGVLRQTLRNWTIQVAYRFGVSPKSLAEFYRRQRFGK